MPGGLARCDVLTYLRSPRHVLVRQVPSHVLHELNLLVHRQARDGELYHVTKLHLVDGDEGVVVDMREEAHDELAIHAVRHAAVTRDGLAKVLDLEGALEPRGEEATKRSDEGGKRREDERVELHRREAQRDVGVLREEEELREAVGLGDKDRIRYTLEAGEDVGAEVLGEEAHCQLASCGKGLKRQPRRANNQGLGWRHTVTGQMK
jgi:hypothetical protein